MHFTIMPDTLPPVPNLKRARADHQLLPAIAVRWSPRAFDPGRPLTEHDILPLLEAARWAASSSNLQPWRLAWSLRGEPAFDAVLGCLTSANAAWAHRAGALLVGCAVLSKPDGTPNRHCAHDLGQALAQLAVQAAAAGVGVHQMGGFDVGRARAALGVPVGIEPYTAVALGWPGDPAQLEGAARDRELAPRERRPLAEIAPRGGWASSNAPLEPRLEGTRQ
jgi:nitroreductase